jgi:hypothetical protein
MGSTGNSKKAILRLKYGEYYSLKITDSGKNIINSVEVTPSEIISEEKQLSTPTKFPVAGKPSEGEKPTANQVDM